VPIVPVTSPVADEVAIAVSILTPNACSPGVATVPPAVPVNAAAHPIAEATQV
jgi:hypothetical protein